MKVLSKLPKVLRDEIGDDDFSLAIDMGFDTFAVIEITECVDEDTMKVHPAVQGLIERADTYAEYVHRCGGVRIIGRSLGPPIDFDFDGDSADLADFTISIYRNCDRWVDISGIPIVDKPFGNIEKLIDELMADIEKYLYLK